MLDFPDHIVRQDRRSLPLHQQAYTARRLQELIDDPEDQALMVGPLHFQRDRWSLLRGNSAFLVPAGVELLVERNGQVSQVLRNGRFGADTWPAHETIRFFLVRTGSRTLRMIFEGETADQAPHLRAVTVNYRVGNWEQLLKQSRPVGELYSQLRARLQPALFLPTQQEAAVKVQAIVAALGATPELAALGLIVSGGLVERWVAPRTAGPSALDLLRVQVEALRQQQLEVDFREQRGTYYIVVPLLSAQNEGTWLMIYFACTTQYPIQPPLVFVRNPEGLEEPYTPPLLTEWSPRYTLSTIVDAIKRDYEHE